jgi:ribosomal protein L9
MEDEKSEVDRSLLEAAVRTKVELEGAMVVDNSREDGQQCSRRSTADERSSSSVCGVALEMKRRAGPEGNLFGGVTPRMILDGLKARYPAGSWDGKLVKVTAVKDAESGNEIKTKDIKRIGDYTITVMLWKDIDVTFILSIAAE